MLLEFNDVGYITKAYLVSLFDCLLLLFVRFCFPCFSEKSWSFPDHQRSSLPADHRPPGRPWWRGQGTVEPQQFSFLFNVHFCLFSCLLSLELFRCHSHKFFFLAHIFFREKTFSFSLVFWFRWRSTSPDVMEKEPVQQGIFSGPVLIYILA